MKHFEFTFPALLTGEDPETGGTRMQTIYPTLTFQKPADARAVRRAIIRFFKEVYNKKLPVSTAKNMYQLGLEHMRNQNLQLKAQLDEWQDEDVDKVNARVAGIQKRAIERLDAMEEGQIKELA